MKARTYPRTLTCKRNFKTTVQPLEEKNIHLLEKFFESIDDIGLALMRANLMDEYFEKRVKRALIHEDMHILTAWHSDIIIGVLILDRGRLNWDRHTANIHFFTHEKYRRYGIATTLIEEAVPFAKSLGIEKLYAQMIPKHRAAIAMAKKIGFNREATLRDHFKDKYGRYHNLRIYSNDLEAAHRAMEDMISSYHRFSG